MPIPFQDHVHLAVCPFLKGSTPIVIASHVLVVYYHAWWPSHPLPRLQAFYSLQKKVDHQRGFPSLLYCCSSLLGSFRTPWWDGLVSPSLDGDIGSLNDNVNRTLIHRSRNVVVPMVLLPAALDIIFVVKLHELTCLMSHTETRARCSTYSIVLIDCSDKAALAHTSVSYTRRAFGPKAVSSTIKCLLCYR